MTVRDFAVIMFSKELALQPLAVQDVAVSQLWDYVRLHQVMWHKPDELKVEKIFSEYFNGTVGRLRPFSIAEGILFQPEIYRGFLNKAETDDIRGMGFQSVKVNIPR